MADWPATLPQCFESGSYGFSPVENRIMSDMDSGPGKQRQRFTAAPLIHSGVMLMTFAQFQTFRTFVESAIGYADSFTFPNPLDSGATDIIARLDPNTSPPYTLSDDRAPGYVKIKLSIMETYT